MNTDVLADLNKVAQAIYDKKGFNILVLDVHEISTMTDFFIIAEGNVDRHVRAISLYLQDELIKFGHRPVHVEGDQDGEWIVMDYVDFIIHLFIPELREKYAIEELWKKGKIIDVKIEISPLDQKS
ncbi:MAG: ribosome silencing factor [Parachlamydiaceae bacterium]|nr:ribosome silencing factor [Parachlamydiaceae bacterium]